MKVLYGVWSYRESADLDIEGDREYVLSDEGTFSKTPRGISHEDF